jgi:hypothetical protein
MRQAIHLILACLLVLQTQAQMIIVIKKPAAGGCAGVAFSCTPTVIGSDGVSQTDPVYYKGDIVALTSGDVICSVTFRLTKTGGSITGKTYRARIYSLSGTALSASPLAVSDAVTGSDSWSATDVAFTFSTPYSVSSTTDYAITISISGWPTSDYDGTNYATAVFGANCGAGHMSQWRASDGVRTEDWPTLSLIMTVNKQ